MGIPQILLITVLTLDLGISMGKHGQPRKERHNLWFNLLSKVILLGLPYWGGFFV